MDNEIDKNIRAIDIPCFTIKRALFHNVFGGKNYYNNIKEYEEKLKLEKKLGVCNCQHAYGDRIKWDRKYYEDLINNASVYDLKTKVNDTIKIGEEMVPCLLYFANGIGLQRFNTILGNITFYDNYIESLLQMNYQVENPFYYMQEEKLEVVKENEVEILSFLDKEGVEFVFGPMNNYLELAIDSKTHDRGNKKYSKLDSIDTIIANYVTPDEVQNITSPKVLSKFIIPYGKK